MLGTQWVVEQGLGFVSSALIIDENGVPFSDLELEQILGFLAAGDEHGGPGGRGNTTLSTDSGRSPAGRA